MSTNTITNSFAPLLSSNSKVLTLETTLQKSLLDFKDLVIDMEQMQISFDHCKAQYLELQEKCENKTCCGAEETEKLIQLTRSALIRLSETKNLDILNEIFKILFGETTTLSYQTTIKCKEPKVKEEPHTPNKQLDSSNEELSFNEESVSEIDGTPTGRSSPIIQTKKLKNSLLGLDREKKKCPDSWTTPEAKCLKLKFATPSRCKQNVNLRQARLNFVKTKPITTIDITCSPEFSGGSRTAKTEIDCDVQPSIKKESIENDDTILPSPTSGPTNFTLFKSPIKFKKPPLSLKTKTEKGNNINKKSDPDIENKIIKTEVIHNDKNKYNNANEIKYNNSVTFTEEDSINILHPNRLPNGVKKSPPANQEHNEATFCDSQSSISLLEHVNKLDDIHKESDELSPTKRPLAENINVINIPEDEELQASMSVLQRDTKVSKLAVENVKLRIAPQMVDEDAPVPRTRAEKRLLPGWACRECINFFSELYKNDPELMMKKINECSHHRGVTNPERPKTPPGYWNPRWNVPDDTEEFNRRNNV